MISTDHAALIAEFGKSVGLDDLRFQEDTAILSFDDIAVEIRTDDERRHYGFAADLGDAPGVPHADILRKFVDLACGLAVTTGLSLILDTNSGRYLLADKLDYEGADISHFEKCLKRLIEQAEVLAPMLRSAEFLSISEPAPSGYDASEFVIRA
ncbi:type III secretion system chaperone [Roseibium sp.]|uniref:type III secretion system chaperone n=1 Tax=Roseibium sp. TaxID=1936156 RepID=UPI0032635690